MLMDIIIFPSTAVDCGQPSSPRPNGDVSVSMTTLGNMATYTCDSGYELVPDNSARTCQADATWSGMDPLCQGMNYAIRWMLNIELISIPCCTFPAKIHAVL